MATQLDQREIDLQEQIARIKQMIDDSDRARAESYKACAETQAIPCNGLFQAMIATAGLLGAGATAATLFFTYMK